MAAPQDGVSFGRRFALEEFQRPRGGGADPDFVIAQGL
jgi:hypothetical protein